MNHTFPKALTALPNWVCWRLEKVKGRDCKVPYNPRTGGKAMPNKPETWATFDEAVAAMQKYGFLGIGFMFTLESGIVGIDLDKCFDENGQPNAIAAAILAKVGATTYVELSPSKTGLHLFLKGTLPKGGRRNSANGVEIYSEKRYFTMTGVQYQNCVDKIADDNGSLAWIHDTYIKPPKKQTSSAKGKVAKGTSCLSDDELIKMASNKDQTFSPLWNGQWEGGKYKSQSEADMALCGKLAWWANADSTQTDRLFRQSGLMREKWTGDYAAETVRVACDNIVDGFNTPPKKSAPRKKKEVYIFEENGCYYIQRGDNVKQLTTYIIVAVEMVVSDEETQYTCDFVTPIKTYRLNMLAEDFSNLDKFKKKTTKTTIALGYLGTSGDLEVFKTFIQELDWKEKIGVKTLGIYNHNDALTFVSVSGAVKERNIAVDTIVQMQKHNIIDSNILDKGFFNSKMMKALGTHILTYNEYPKTVSILAWVAGCFIKYHLKESETKYPHFVMIGISGSGKSWTFERVICAIFSRYVILASSQATSFGLMIESNSSNLIPQFINEFKPSTLPQKVRKAIINHMRDSYDKHGGIRGKGDLTLSRYELLAPVLIAGEQNPAEAAIRERTIELLFSRCDIEDGDYETAFKWISANKPMMEDFGRTLLDVALRTTPEEANEWYKEGYERVKGNFPSRVTTNLACVYSGLKLVEKLCGFFELEWNEVFPIDFDMCVKHLMYAVKEYLLDGGNHSRTVIEETFEIMARMNLKYEKDYTIENSGKHLCLRLKAVYDDFTQYRVNHAILGEVLTYNDFKQQLKKSGYVVNPDKPTDLRYFNGKRVRVWVLNYEKLQSVCDVEDFWDNSSEATK